MRNWEQDRRRPYLASADRLARALGVPLDVLEKVAAEQADPGEGD